MTTEVTPVIRQEPVNSTEHGGSDETIFFSISSTAEHFNQYP